MEIKKDDWLYLAPVISVLLFFGLRTSVGFESSVTISITLMTISWWVTTPVSVPVAALIPVVLLPLFGVLTPEQASSSLGHPIIWLIIGVFFLSKALESCKVHIRLAVSLIHFIGITSAKRLLLGFTFASGLLSMWIADVATVAIMLPLVLAMTKTIESRKFKIRLILAITYGASIGGMGTLIGTPTNILFASIYHMHTGKMITFLEWMRVGFPVALVCLMICGFWLGRGLEFDDEKFNLPDLGKWREAEKRVLIIFALTALAWMFKSAPFGGWSQLFNVTVSDGRIAILGSMLMFLVSDGKGQRLLSWEQAVQIPWGVIIIITGGFTLSKGLNASGVSDIIGQLFSFVTYLPLFLVVLCFCCITALLTETTSIVTVSTLFLPVLAVVIKKAGLTFDLILIPATLAASCAFMMPVAMPQNAIAFAKGNLKVSDMVKLGSPLALMVVTTVAVMGYAMLS